MANVDHKRLTTPNAHAVPRVAWADAATRTADATSYEATYQFGLQLDTAGLYYWDGAAWQPCGSAAAIGAGADNAIARYDGTAAVQSSGITIDDADNVTGVAALNIGDSGAPQAALDVNTSNSTQSAAATILRGYNYNNHGIRLGNAGYATMWGYQRNGDTTGGGSYGTVLAMNAWYDSTNWYTINGFVPATALVVGTDPDGSGSGTFTFYSDPDQGGSAGTYTPTEVGKLDSSGNWTISGIGSATSHVFSSESASVPGGAPGAGTGKLWVRSDTPNVLVFTDDSGADTVLGAGGGGGNTLDQAYDQGGAGAGRTITVDSGAVTLDADVVDTSAAFAITREPASSAAAVGMSITMGSFASGPALSITNNGSGHAISANAGKIVGYDPANFTTPSFTFSGDDNSGLGHASADTPAMIVGGTWSMLWQSGGVTVTGTGGGSKTAPVFRIVDSNSGMYRTSSGNWSAAAGGNQAQNWTATTVGLYAADSEVMRVDNTATAGNTALLIYDVDNATLERVSVGAADSGGTNFKVLRIPN